MSNVLPWLYSDKMEESGYAALPGPSQQASLVSASTDQDQFYIVNYEYNAQVKMSLMINLKMIKVSYCEILLIFFFFSFFHGCAPIFDVFTWIEQEGDELSVSRGDVVRLLVQGLDGWWTVERNGCCGLVPGNYLGKIWQCICKRIDPTTPCKSWPSLAFKPKMSSEAVYLWKRNVFYLLTWSYMSNSSPNPIHKRCGIKDAYLQRRI